MATKTIEQDQDLAKSFLEHSESTAVEENVSQFPPLTPPELLGMESVEQTHIVVADAIPEPGLKRMGRYLTRMVAQLVAWDQWLGGDPSSEKDKQESRRVKAKGESYSPF